MNRFNLFFGPFLICILFTPTYVSADFNSTANDKINIKPDLSLISGKKFPLTINANNYDIYYGIVLGESSDQDYNGAITSMNIVPEKKSLLIVFDNILQTDNVWVRFPNEMLSAEKAKFVLLVDGIEKGYELSSHGTDTRLGFIIQKGTHQVEIVGNNVIPEFPLCVMPVILVVFGMVVFFTRYQTKIKIQY
ncbi:MAG TPA: hypothetical protein VLD38_08465 [Nitrosopumilaceae archaeon]|nr:hypothetical protein [Nitrosopumilaceae archaeon]